MGCVDGLERKERESPATVSGDRKRSTKRPAKMLLYISVGSSNELRMRLNLAGGLFTL